METGDSQLPLNMRLHLSNTSITEEIAVCSMQTGLESLKLLFYKVTLMWTQHRKQMMSHDVHVIYCDKLAVITGY